MPIKARILGLTGLSIAILIAFICYGQIAVPSDSRATRTEYQGLSIYITRTFTDKSGWERTVSHATKIVIANKSQSDTDDENNRGIDRQPIPWNEAMVYLHKNCPTLELLTLDSFREASTHQADFKPLFRLPVKYELIDKRQFLSILAMEGWWTDYYEKYPGSQGFLTLSRVGFSPDGKHVLFYASNGCGGKCGTGSYVVMQKIGSSWKVLKEILRWIS